jgi:hypothetical protein
LAGLIAGVAAGLDVTQGSRIAEEQQLVIFGEDSQPQQYEGFGSSAAVAIDEAHALIVTHGGAIVSGHIQSISEGDAATVELAVDDVLWSIDSSGTLPPEATVMIDAGPRDVQRVRDFGGEEIVALVTADGRLIGLASLGPSGDLGGPMSDDLFYVAWVAEWLIESDFAPGATDDACEGPSPPSPNRSELQALVEYFAAFGNETRQERDTAAAAARSEAEVIALEAGSFTDPVTGIAVRPSLNHISKQVAAGVSRSGIELRPEVPVLITVPDINNANDVLVFYDAQTGEWISWVGTGPQYGASGEVITTKKVYLEPPDQGHSVAMTFRPASEVSWECPLGAGENPLVVVAFDDIAGAKRVRIDVASGTYTNASQADFDEVRKGTFKPPPSESDE